jgi:hypothetical protein
MCIQKKQNKIFVLSIFLISLIFAACNKQGDPPAVSQQSSSGEISKAGNSGSVTTAGRSSSAEAYAFERIPVQHRISPTDGKLPLLPFRTGAHREHLNDPLTFMNLPDGGIPSGPTAVVGSDLCLFYPLETISSEAELAKLPKGEAIPFATIIPLGNKLENSDGDKANMFEFQDNLNFFYKTTWNGKRGIVFGADLYGIGASNEDNRLSALLYKDSGYFGNFYPVNGYEKISPTILAELETNGLAIQEVKPSEYRLSLEGTPDDMISLYVFLAARNRAPMFVTTDLAAHANHLVFDRMLQYVEENYFFPQMIALTDEYIKAIEQQKAQIPENVYTTSLLYFQTAQALLALAPKRVKGTDYFSTVEYQDVNAEEVLQNYPPRVIAEIEKMDRAAGKEKSSVFTFGKNSELALEEDYSQYKVRGHYTKNGVLGAYFRALMWYGRINFTLGDEGGNTSEFALQFAPTALFIADLTENSPDLKKLWSSLFDPITEIIGASDDISFNELIPLWNNIKGAGFAQWSKDPKKIEAFITQGHKELRSPAISGSSLFSGTYAGGPAMAERLPPKGWRLFGQRYTLDNEIHHWVSPPRLPYRDMVRGLDILKVFGSKTADSFLKESDYANHTRLEATLNSLQRNLSGVKDDYWLST